MTTEQPWAGQHLHLVGIGGAGMSGYARVAQALGATVSGSDQQDSPALQRLRDLGIDARGGHDAANIPPQTDEVFHSSAIPESNPERQAAAQRGLADHPRAVLLDRFSALKPTIAIAGAHGKTTTTSMIAHALLEMGAEPSYLIGGDLRSTGLNAEWRPGRHLVVEADESDRSMLSLNVDIALVLNVELDHHATYGSIAELEAVYDEFTGNARHWALWTPPDHHIDLQVPGIHNQHNAAAALAALQLAGYDPAAAERALRTFPGAGRRFEDKGMTASGARVVDDYAHHPTEVAATIAAAREVADNRVVAIFQPHLFSRTEHLHAEFAKALSHADLVALLDVYPARERQEDFPDVTSRLILDGIDGPPALYPGDHATAVTQVAPELQPGDLVLTMGAGDITTLGPMLAQHRSAG